MVPAAVDPNVSPPGEVLLFGLLRDHAPEDWIVLHSVDLPIHVRQIEGEIDFVVFVPGAAVICLEVKSHRSVRRTSDGFWQMGSSDPVLRSPFQQASEGMHSLRRRFEDEPDLSDVPFVSAVVFPMCEFSVDALEWEPWQVIDERQIQAHGIESAVRHVAQKHRQRLLSADSAHWFRDSDNRPTPTQCRRMAARVRPVFERAQSPKARRAEVAAEVARYTEEQFAALDAMEDNPRVVFVGGAGTGKTFLAIEAARRASLLGRRVGVVCYNRLLGDWLQEQLAPLGNVHAGTVHSTLLSVAQVDVPQDGQHHFFEEVLPDLAVEALLNGHPMAAGFDTLVIDEAQDLCTSPLLDALDLMVAGGLATGDVVAFGDFAHQNIYRSDGALDLLDSRSPNARFRLTVNCRNRPRVGELLTVAARTSPYSAFRRPDDGYNVELKIYRTDAEQRACLTSAIDAMRGEGFQLGDIAVLSTKANGIASTVDPPHEAWLAPAGSSPTPKIRTSTIHAFKGLESPVVIATDFDSLSSPEDLDLLYTAVSRVTDRLILLLGAAVQQDFAELIIGGEK